MKKIKHYAILFSLSINLYAQEVPSILLLRASPFQNIREGNSSLISEVNESEIERHYKDSKSIEVLREIIRDPSINGCASKVISTIKNKLMLKDEKDIELAILGLRLDDSIDDIAANILIKANKLTSPLPGLIAKKDLSDAEETKALEIFKENSIDIKNKALCMEDTYRNIIGSLVSESQKYGKNLKHINRLALDNNLINNSDYKIFETLRASKVQEWPLTLSEYHKSLSTIAKSFPDRKKEQASIVTKLSVGKIRSKKSLRQSLFEKFDSNQIILLASMVKNLKKRLDSKDISINITYVDQESEVIDLSPMEKFRFILKLLRKDLSRINNSSILNGYKANYIDIITASYEVGYISAMEFEELAKLEDIWNPKKTPKEKAVVWAKRFGGVASILLPPPFGFIAVMAIMIIDQQISEAPINRDADYNLF